MKTKLPVYLLSALLFGSSIQAFSQTTDYQVTGPVLELNAKKIVVQKGDEKWEIARDASTKVDGELKIGSKVTIHYRMVATRVDVKSYVNDKLNKVR
jgi:hypothetical protein